MKARGVFVSLLFFLICALMVGGCTPGGWGDIPKSSEKAITAYSVNGVVGTINEIEKTIVVVIPFSANLTELVATFTTTGIHVKVGTTTQESGVTVNNFTTSLIYIVTAADGTEVNYTVTVTLSSEKAITEYSINGVIGTIDETAKTITVTLPDGTNDVTALVATFTTTGVRVELNSTVQVSETTENNFTNPVTYTVTAANSSTQDYTVTLKYGYISANIGTLKYVPAGSFQRDDSVANISIITTAFRMGQYEITRSQFLAIMGTDPTAGLLTTGMNDPEKNINWYHIITFCNKLSIAEGLMPVYNVSGVDFSTLTFAVIPTTSNATWDAVTANWSANGYRLPTDMEWMWAAMGATSGYGYMGGVYTTGYTKAFAGSTGSNAIGDYAVFGWNTGETGSTNTNGTKPVGSKLSNELGLYDMSGNVLEWCWDWWPDYNAYPAGTLTDYRGASGTVKSRVARGGDWENNSSFQAVAFRNGDNPFDRALNFGFRVVRR